MGSTAIEALNEAGEEDLIALYYLIYPDGDVTEERVKMMGFALEYLARRGEVSLGLTRGVAKDREYWG